MAIKQSAAKPSSPFLIAFIWKWFHMTATGPIHYSNVVEQKEPRQDIQGMIVCRNEYQTWVSIYDYFMTLGALIASSLNGDTITLVKANDYTLFPFSTDFPKVNDFLDYITDMLLLLLLDLPPPPPPIHTYNLATPPPPPPPYNLVTRHQLHLLSHQPKWEYVLNS